VPRPVNFPVEITAADPASAEALQAGLAAAGIKATLVSSPSGTAGTVLFTEGLTDAAMTARHWAAMEACRNAKHAGATLVFLQRMSADTGLEGLARTLRREWPDSSAHCWTLLDNVAGDMLAPWLAQPGQDLWISPDGTARRATLGPLLAPAPLPAFQAGLWLVTGGARGVTAACAIELAHQSGGTFILAGRSAETPWPTGIAETTDLKTLRGLMAGAAVKRGEKPSPAAIDKASRAAIAGLEIRSTLAQINAAGADAHYLPIDTSDAASVTAALATIHQRFGPITGLVHGAGVLADRLVEEKTEAELRRVFATKAEGFFHILSGIDRSALRHVGLFSSASAFFGNRGQSDYAMANAILANAGRALHAELPSAQVKVFDWGPWEGGMVDATLATHFKEQGVPLIPLAEGARIFAHELLAGDPTDIELVVGTVWSDQ
jgi:NAD(P)-dependent dehydrogenase (short-subunit alcohol dehydrogenase family)